MEEVQSCIDGGVDLSGDGLAGNILRQACDRDNCEVVEVLMRAGASHGIQGDDNSAPIYVAARRGNLQIVALLIRCGAFYDVSSCAISVS